MAKSNGFTLIELMIVVAIIGLLSAIAIPLYQDNIMKSQVNRALGELAPYKSAFEYQVSNGRPVTNADIDYLPSDLSAGNAGIDIAVSNADGSGHLQVTLGGNSHPSLKGLIIRLERNVKGSWKCVIDPSAASNWKNGLAPGSCSVI